MNKFIFKFLRLSFLKKNDLWCSSFIFAALVLIPGIPAGATIVRFAKVDNGLYRGSQPEDLADYQSLKSLQIKTIVNLRTTVEDVTAERMTARQFNFNFISFPIDGMSTPNPQEVAEILSDLGNRLLLPIFVHCAAGKDRTGMIIGLYRVEYQHWNPSTAYQEMIAFGFDPNLKGLYNFYWAAVKSLIAY